MTWATRYRPQTLDTVVGQPLATATLRRSIEQRRVFPVVVLHGPRGVGKTSLARLYAGGLNENDPTTSPDVLEIDAASARGIEAMARVKEFVQYVPSAQRRVVILDEAHGLTREAWQSLLKTLEEPPPTAVFVFVTTAPAAIPDTVLSRALVLPCPRVTADEIEVHLQRVADAEGVVLEPDARRALARSAYGAVRDAVQRLEQAALATAGNPVRASDVWSMLPAHDPQAAVALLSSWVAGDLGAALTEAATTAAVVADVPAYLTTLDDVLVAVAIAQQGVDVGAFWGPELAEEISRLAPQVGARCWAWRALVQAERREPWQGDPATPLLAITARAMQALVFAEQPVIVPPPQPAPNVSMVTVGVEKTSKAAPQHLLPVPAPDRPAPVTPPSAGGAPPDEFGRYLLDTFGVSQ